LKLFVVVERVADSAALLILGDDMKILFIFVILSFNISHAETSIAGLPSAFYGRILQARDGMVQNNFWQESVPTTCHSQIANLARDGEIRITVALGYMDVSLGQEADFSSDSYYQIGHVLDHDAKKGLEYALTERCLSPNHFACGFRKSRDIYTKQIHDRWSGQRKTVRIELLSPSVSVINTDNSGPLLSQQNRSSQDTESRYLSAFRTSDAVLYLGHARSGGGPDFFPPQLLANGKVDYSYYKQNQPGLRKMLSAVTNGQTPIVGVFACKSTGLFSASIKRQSPESIVITADELFNYNNILPTAYSTIEAIVGQRCGSTFEDIVRIVPGSEHNLSLFF
jgi:hypothetical protein